MPYCDRFNVHTGFPVRCARVLSHVLQDWEEGVCIQDKLRMAMCKRDTDEWDAIPEHMRKELLFGVSPWSPLHSSMVVEASRWELCIDRNCIPCPWLPFGMCILPPSPSHHLSVSA